MVHADRRRHDKSIYSDRLLSVVLDADGSLYAPNGESNWGNGPDNETARMRLELSARVDMLGPLTNTIDQRLSGTNCCLYPANASPRLSQSQRR